jgi:hypothetical protein
VPDSSPGEGRRGESWDGVCFTDGFDVDQIPVSPPCSCPTSKFELAMSLNDLRVDGYLEGVALLVGARECHMTSRVPVLAKRGHDGFGAQPSHPSTLSSLNGSVLRISIPWATYPALLHLEIEAPQPKLASSRCCALLKPVLVGRSSVQTEQVVSGSSSPRRLRQVCCLQSDRQAGRSSRHTRALPVV